MPQSRTRYQRAAKRSRYRKPKRKRSGSMGWNVAIGAVFLVGILVIGLTVIDRQDSGAGSGPPHVADQAANQPQDHWHTAFQVNICGEWLNAQPQFEFSADNSNVVAGIHTHGDNLIHTHPRVIAEAGENATLSKFAEYAGWSVSSDSINGWVGPESKPDQKEWSNGDTCPFGEYKGKKGVVSWAVDGKPKTGNPSDYKLEDGETLGIYFLPKGVDQPFPPDACNEFNTISDVPSAVLSKNSPCRAALPTTSTAPSDSTTTTPPTSTP